MISCLGSDNLAGNHYKHLARGSRKKEKIKMPNGKKKGGQNYAHKLFLGAALYPLSFVVGTGTGASSIWMALCMLPTMRSRISRAIFAASLSVTTAFFGIRARANFEVGAGVLGSIMFTDA